MAKINIEGISKRYAQQHVLSDLSLNLQDGECFALLGPSGCGKTVLMRLIAGFEKLDRGRILIGDETVSDAHNNQTLPPERRSLGMVFQDYAVWPHMDVFANVAYPLKLAKVEPTALRERTQRTITQVGLGGLEARLPSQLSGGQQQRVALARALVSEPKLLLLDEPLNNLDANLREEMRFEIKTLQKKLGVTILYVTHDQEIALGIADRIAVMDETGVIRQTDTPENIYERPVDDFVFRFLGIANFLPVVRQATGLYIANSDIAWTSAPPDKAGECWTAGFRPSDALLSRHSKHSEGIPARVCRTSFLGAQVDYLLNISGHLIRVAVHCHECAAAGTFFAEGETCYINLATVQWFNGNIVVPTKV